MLTKPAKVFLQLIGAAIFIPSAISGFNAFHLHNAGFHGTIAVFGMLIGAIILIAGHPSKPH